MPPVPALQNEFVTPESFFQKIVKYMGREKQRLSSHLPIDDRRTSAVSWVYTLLSSLVGDLEAASVTEGTELLNQNQNTYQLRWLQRLRFLFISQEMSESLAEMAVDSSGGRLPAGVRSIIGPVASVLDQTDSVLALPHSAIILQCEKLTFIKTRGLATMEQRQGAN